MRPPRAAPRVETQELPSRLIAVPSPHPFKEQTMNGTTLRRAAAAVSALAITAVLLAACVGSSEPETLTFDLEIKENEWNLAADGIQVNQGDTINLNIESDVDGNIHVHGYDLTVEVTADTPGALEFLANATGRFSITYHVEGTDSEHEEEEDEGEGEQQEAEPQQESEFLRGALEVRPR